MARRRGVAEPRWRSEVFLSLLLLCLSFYLLLSVGLFDALRVAFQSVDAEDVWLEGHKKTALRRIQWDDESMNETEECRNSRQGHRWMADERGFLCLREDLPTSGCCPPSSSRFACGRCDESVGCCEHFEECVSCCLRPDRKELLVAFLQHTQGHRLRHFLAARDHFELCLIKCRTSSASVFFENKYKSRVFKHCYKAESLPRRNSNEE